MPITIKDAEYVKLSAILQDLDELERQFNAETQILNSAEPGTDMQLAYIHAEIKGLKKALGEKGRRGGAIKIQGPDIQLTGQITSSGDAVTGIGTAFSTEIVPGDVIYSSSNNEYRTVKTIADPPFEDTVLTLYNPFPADITTPEDLYKQGTGAGRIRHFDQGDSTTTYHAEDKHLNIQGTGTLRHDGMPAAGYLIDGTPIYKKYINITIPDTLTFASGAHGISNAYTNKRIITVRTWYDAGSPIFQLQGGETTGDSYRIYAWSVDDTNLIISRSLTTGTNIFRCWIEYI